MCSIFFTARNSVTAHLCKRALTLNIGWILWEMSWFCQFTSVLWQMWLLENESCSDGKISQEILKTNRAHWSWSKRWVNRRVFSEPSLLKRDYFKAWVSPKSYMYQFLRLNGSINKNFHQCQLLDNDNIIFNQFITSGVICLQGKVHVQHYVFGIKHYAHFNPLIS